MIQVLVFTLFGYGVKITYEKGNFNPQNPNSTNDGSIKQWEIYKSKTRNPYISLNLNWDYNFTFILVRK